MRRAAKRDASEPEIVDTLRNLGCGVWRLSDPDLPDLLVADYRGVLHLLEVKTGNAKLRPGQETFARDMAAKGVAVKVVRNSREAIDAIGFTWAPEGGST